MVESQHIASSMKLVDTLEEQDLLEMLLESSKPMQPDQTKGLHYLLATPFRYHPKRGGSRFRAMHDPGVFYAAETIRTVGAELGYWRWKFLQDAQYLVRLEPVAHTAFRIDIDATIVDLQREPFYSNAQVWQHPTDYSQTQQFARTAREADVMGIMYSSVRDVKPAWCLALLTPKGFAKSKPYGADQTWYLAVSQQAVTLRGGGESIQYSTECWR
jgi:hypothetical protein